MSKETNSILDFDLTTLSNAYKEKRVSPVEVLQLTLEKIKELDDRYHAYITVCYENALEEARKAEKEINDGRIKSPLHGVPIALKDLFYTKNVKTTMGSGAYKDFVPDYDATVVSKLKQAGAILIGKTNTHEFAYGPTGDYSYFGPIRNPYDVSKMAGGSSGGSAAAVAASLS
jgi:aspartyl-tRNA(Asn)/glutamyl-tRNA(Gln) amidotransferase subunit A